LASLRTLMRTRFKRESGKESVNPSKVLSWTKRVGNQSWI
jgi:hypothetical protein